ncbi:MAG: CPBP family intramembrane metalloprotease [Clostridiales bacterium]|nr:CPBP family intramembrane metalloprotease [Clostridiales bacterium]
MNQNHEVKQFNLLQIFLYHLLPGVPILLIALVCANPSWGLGLPILLSLTLGIAFGLLPVQWAILYITARKQGKKLRDIIGFTEKTPPSKLILWTLPCAVFALFIFMVVAPIEHPFWTIFNWIPDWFRINRFDPSAQKGFILTLSLIMNFVFNGLLAPFTEEVYFRGFLLPRMGKLGKAAPFVNTALFSLYHLFTPWENITRILAITPMVYAVWVKKNIRIGIWTHCGLNTLSCIGLLFM